MPATTRPKTVYFASRCGCGECVMKNWLPPVSAQSIAIPTDEVRDDAVDTDAVEIAFARQRDEVLHRQRRIQHRQLDLNRAAIGIDVELCRHRRRDEPGRLIDV